jgi:ornithine--oxo-acid transaminase
MASLQVLEQEKLAENAAYCGEIFRGRMNKINSPLIKAIRGMGLLNAIDIQPFGNGKTAWDVCIELMKKGLLAKQTHNHTIRFAPPLTISEQQVNSACDIIEETLMTLS